MSTETENIYDQAVVVLAYHARAEQQNVIIGSELSRRLFRS